MSARVHGDHHSGVKFVGTTKIAIAVQEQIVGILLKLFKVRHSC
jgi:hypothetical protein